jgi:hypothetical protein
MGAIGPRRPWAMNRVGVICSSRGEGENAMRFATALAVFAAAILCAACARQASAAWIDSSTANLTVTINGAWSASSAGGSAWATTSHGQVTRDAPPYPVSASRSESQGLSSVSASGSGDIELPAIPAPTITGAASVTHQFVDQPMIGLADAIGGGGYKLISTSTQNVTITATWSYEVDFNNCNGEGYYSAEGAWAQVNVFFGVFKPPTGPGNDSLLPAQDGWIRGGNYMAVSRRAEFDHPGPGSMTGLIGGVTTWQLSVPAGTYLLEAGTNVYLAGILMDVPEPATLATLMLAGMAIVTRRRR